MCWLSVISWLIIFHSVVTKSCLIQILNDHFCPFLDPIFWKNLRKQMYVAYDQRLVVI